MLYIILLLPIAMAVFCGLQKNTFCRTQMTVLTAAQAVVTALCVIVFVHGHYGGGIFRLTEQLSFSLCSDIFGSFFAVLIAALWLLSIPYSSAYMQHEQNRSRFFLFFFLTESAMLGSAFAADMMTFYLFFELTTFCSVPLVLHSLSGKALLGAGKYLYFSMAGAFAALFGMAAVFHECGTLTFVQGGFMETATPLTLAAVFCMVVGFSAKAGLFPLHSWLSSAHPVAPTPASALLSGIIAKVGVLGVIRAVYFMAGPECLQGTWVQTALICMALLTIFMGSFMAVTEDGLKKRLAYSSISNLSYILLGIFVLTPLGLTGALLQLLFHALAKVGIFQCAGSVIVLTGTETVSDFPALGKKLPLTMLCFTGFSLSLVGIPPFGGFYSKWYLALAGLESMSGFLRYAIPAVLLISALLTAIYLFWPVTRAFFPGKEHLPVVRVHEPWQMVLPIGFFALLCLILGIFHPAIVSFMDRIVAAIL